MFGRGIPRLSLRRQGLEAPRRPPPQRSGAHRRATGRRRGPRVDDDRRRIGARLRQPRTASDASWATGKSVEEIAKLKSEGQLLGRIQWCLIAPAPIGMAADGYVLEWRNLDADKNLWPSNLDSATRQREVPKHKRPGSANRGISGTQSCGDSRPAAHSTSFSPHGRASQSASVTRRDFAMSRSNTSIWLAANAAS